MLHIALTLLELGGYDAPSSMQGTLLLESPGLSADVAIGLSVDEAELIRERLSGLGYIA